MSRVETLPMILTKRILYRYEDNYQNTDYGYREPYLYKFDIVRETEKSYFIRLFLCNTKRVPKDGKNIFAWDTEVKALFNYLKRKEYQVAILRNRLRTAERNLKFAEKELLKHEELLKENPTSHILCLITKLKLKEEKDAASICKTAD